MLVWIQSHPIVFLVALLAALVALIPLGRSGVLALHAWRGRQTAVAKTDLEKARLAGVDTLTALGAQLVLSAEREVRDLKDPLKPGTWNPAVDGPRVFQRVVHDLWTFGGDTITQLRALQGLSVGSTTKLLESIAEAQVQKLRAPPKPAAGATPAELAALVAEILRDPTTRPAVATVVSFDPALTQDVTDAARVARSVITTPAGNDDAR